MLKSLSTVAKAFYSCFFLILLQASVMAKPTSWAIAIHGGAGGDPQKMTPSQIEAVQDGLKEALHKGISILSQGGTALDCVEQVVRVLEERPEFNAGKGAVFNAQGQHELDASIMDGRDRSCGAVAALRTVRNPISLARKVMEQTPHVFLTGSGAEQFATEQSVERVNNSWFDTEERRLDWEHSKGTVGCVALDANGNLAAATSTGGLTDKKWGRVGDSPIIGAGTYADNRSCAVSCTGTGEEFIRRSIAHDVSARMLYGEKTLEQAAQEAMLSLPDDTGGLICVSKDGKLVLLFNTQGMARGLADSNGHFDLSIGK